MPTGNTKGSSGRETQVAEIFLNVNTVLLPTRLTHNLAASSQKHRPPRRVGPVL